MILCETPTTTRLSAAVTFRPICLTAKTPAPKRGRYEPKTDAFLPLRFLYPRRSHFSEFRWPASDSPGANKSKHLFAGADDRPASAGFLVSGRLTIFKWRRCPTGAI